jgi:RHS repeat-associated protein
VLVTISDRKIAENTVIGQLVTYYKPVVVTANDYYPFGMIMPGRNFNNAGFKDYRYGFNGKENDNEVKGEGGQQDYGMRIYDPRLGKFLSVDPITADYPWYTPYQFAGNMSIWAIDLDGLEPAEPLVRGTNPVLQRIGAGTGPKQGTTLNGNGMPYNPAHYNSDGSLKGEYTIWKTTSWKEIKANLYPSMGRDLEFKIPNERNPNPLGVDASDFRTAVPKPFSMHNSSGNPPQKITTDPSTLTDEDLAETEKRLLAGTATFQDWIYKQELDKRKNAGTFQPNKGRTVLDDFKQKLPNSFKGIDKKHLTAAIGDMNGKPIIKYGKVWDHLGDISGFMRSLNGKIKELNRLINSNAFSGATLEDARKLRTNLQKTYDSFRAALQRAANSTGTSINLKKKGG